MKKTILIFLSLIFSYCVQNLNAQIAKNKIAGVCFRVDDIQSISNWNDYAALFGKYNFNFCLSQNLDLKLSDTTYLNLLRNLTLQGNELLDHTPSHSMVYITMQNYADTLAYSSNPYVHHINGKKVCFNQGDIVNSTPGSGLVDLINGNMLISQNNGGFNQIGYNTNPYYFGIFIPELNNIFTYLNIQNLNPNDPDTITIRSYWDETIALPNTTNMSYSKLDQQSVVIPFEVRKLLAQRTIFDATTNNLPIPKTIILPSGPYPLLNENQIKEVWGDLYNYTSGNSTYNTSYKCYNEYNPLKLKRWGVTWGDFIEENQSLKDICKTISNKIAKHYVQIGQSHFINLTGGWSGYLSKMDSLLNWLKINNIPVKTYKEWTDNLFDSVPNPYINIFPSPSIDLDKDGIPDGYDYCKMDTTDGVSQFNYKSFAVSNFDMLFNVQRLAGIEIGSNSFSAYTKGAPGDSIRIWFSFYGNPLWIPRKIPADKPNWTKYSVQFDIPDSLTMMSIQASVTDYTSGVVKMSGIELRKLSTIKLNPIENQKINANELFTPVDLKQYVTEPLYLQSEIHFLSKNTANISCSIDSNKILSINKINPFWIGKDSVLITVTNPDNSSDSVFVTFETIQPEICFGESLNLSVDPTASVTWSSQPVDISMTNVNNNNQLVYPKESTTYIANIIFQSGDTNQYQLNVIVHQSAIAEAGNDMAVCYNETIKLSASGGIQYSWNNGVIQDQYFNSTIQGYYTVQVTDEHGCSAKDSLYLTVYPIPNVGEFDAISSICFNNSTTLKVNNTSGDINWQVLNGNQWNDITDANLSIYTTPMLTTNSYFRIKASNTNCTVYSAQPLVVVVNPIIAAGSISSTSLVCTGSPATIIINGNNGNVEWQASVDGLNDWTPIGNADRNTTTFITPPVYNNTYFRAKVSNDNCGEAYTNTIALSTKQPSIGGNMTLVSPICIGSNSNLQLNANTGNIQWQLSADKGNTWLDIITATLPQFTTSSLTKTTYFRAKVIYQDCPLSYSNIDSVLVDSLSIGGLLSGALTICQGNNTTITLSNYKGAIQWQQSIDSLNWQTATGFPSNNTFNTGSLNVSTYFRASVTNGGCQASTSNTIKIKVDSMSTGGYALANSPVCYGNPSYVTLTGYYGNILWQYSWDGGITWANLTNNVTETSPLLIHASQITTEYFRASVKNGVCPYVYSVPDSVVVNNHAVGGTVGTIAPICQGKTVNCYLYNYTGNIQWQQSIDTISWNDVTSGTNATTWTYTTPALNSTIYYRARLTNGVCPTAYSTYKPAVVNPIPVPTVSINISNGNNPQYSPADSVTFNTSIANGGTTPVYKWLKNGTTVGTNNTNFVYIPANGDQITCQITSNASCATITSATSNSITMSVNNNPVSITGTLDAVAPICYNTSTMLHISNCIGNIQWQQLTGTTWSDIPNAISAYYQTPPLANTTQFRVAVSYSNYPVYYLSPVTVTVYPQTIGGSLSSLQTICSGSSVSLSLSGHNGNIEWEASNDGLIWNTIGTSNINNYVFSTSSLFNNTYFRAKVSNGNCEIAYSNIDTVTVNQSSFSGSITAVSPVCSGTNSVLSLSNSYNSIQWQTSSDKNVWSDIANATNQQLITNVLSKTTYYRAKVSTFECPLIYTAIDSVLIDSLSLGGLLTGATTICQGSITTLNISNYRGIAQLQQSTDSLNWQTIPGSPTNNMFYSGYLFTKTYFRAAVINKSCQTATSNVVKINVDSMSTAGIPFANSPVCYGNPSYVTLTGYYGNILWQYSWDGGITWANLTNNVTETSPLLIHASQITTEYFRASVKNGVCPYVYSVPDSVVVNNHAVGGTVGTIAPICQGKTVNCYLYNYTGNIQWQQSIDTISWNDVTTGTNATTWTYTTPALNSTLYYRARLTNGVCPTVYSTIKPAVVNPVYVPTATVNITSGSNPQNSPADSVGFNAVITNGGSAPVYKWLKNGITVGTNSTFYKYVPINNDLIKIQLTSNALCATPATVTSNVITMVVNKPKSAMINQTHYNYQTVCLTDKPFTISGFSLCQYKDDTASEREFIFDPLKYGYGTHDILCNTFDNVNGINDSVINRIYVVNCNEIKPNGDVDFIIFPNPCNNEFKIIPPFNSSEFIITIYDINSKVIFTKSYNDINTSYSDISINTSSFKSGVYSVRIINKDFNTVKKLIITK